MGSLRQAAHEQFAIRDPADAGALRRAVGRHAEHMLASPERRGAAELAATELATNLLRHADPGGYVLTRPVAPAGIELIAVDRGPGIADLDAVLARPPRMRDGLGCGLAAVGRASARFEIQTRASEGTVVLAVIDLSAGRGAAQPRRWAGVSVPVTDPCGDGWAVADLDTTTAVAVIDGLGHGTHASAATDAALDTFSADPSDIAGFLARANHAMRATRGAALALAHLDPDAGEMRYLAIGNISGRILAADAEHGLPSHRGTLGMHHAPPNAKITTHPWPRGATLLLWTDGLRSQLTPPAANDLRRHDPAVTAARLHRDHTRHRDDATVVVVHNPAAEDIGRAGAVGKAGAVGAAG